MAFCFNHLGYYFSDAGDLETLRRLERATFSIFHRQEYLIGSGKYQSSARTSFRQYQYTDVLRNSGCRIDDCDQLAPLFQQSLGSRILG